MSDLIKKDFKYEERVGDISATQPLSGTKIVNTTNIKGFNASSFVRVEEQKKTS